MNPPDQDPNHDRAQRDHATRHDRHPRDADAGDDGDRWRLAAEPLVTEAHDGWIAALAFQPRAADGDKAPDRHRHPSPAADPDQATFRLLSAGNDDRLCLWRTPAQPPEHQWAAGCDGVTAAGFSPDGSLIAAGGWNGDIRLWRVPPPTPAAGPADQPPPREIGVLRGHRENITSLAFSPGGERLASGSGDDTLKIWDLIDLEPVMTLAGEDEYDISTVDWSADGRWVVTGDGENRVRLWDADTGEQRARWRRQQGPVSAVAFAPDSRRLVSGSFDHSLALWQIDRRHPLSIVSGHRADVTAVAFTADGRWLLSAGEDGRLLAWSMAQLGSPDADQVNASAGHPARDIEPRELLRLDHMIPCFALDPSGRQLAIGGQGAWQLWRLAHGGSAEPGVEVGAGTMRQAEAPGRI